MGGRCLITNAGWLNRKSVTAWAAMDSASSPSGMTPPKVPRQRKRWMYLVANRKAWVNRTCQRSSVRTGSECGWLPVMPGNEHKVNQIDPFLGLTQDTKPPGLKVTAWGATSEWTNLSRLPGMKHCAIWELT